MVFRIQCVPVVCVSLLVSHLAMSNPAQAFEVASPKLSGAVDLVTDFGIENPPADSGRLRIRSFEFAASSLVDSIWTANVNVGGHDDAGTIDLELHEAFLTSDRLIPSTEIKAGRFFLGVGILNRGHSYEWGFTSPPKSQIMFFAKEPIADTGIEFTRHFAGSIQLDVTGGVTNGWSYTHTATAGRRPLVATHYLHPTAVFTVGEGETLATGLNYLGRTDADSIQTRLVGLDLSYRVQKGERTQTQIQSELYHRIQSSSSLPLAEDIGAYLWGETSLGESNWSVGSRADALTTLSLRNSDGSKRQNLVYGLTPIIAYRASAASTFRAAYSYLMETREGDNSRPEQRVELQLVALFGEQPNSLRSEDLSTR
jgi:hypothetical protein